MEWKSILIGFIIGALIAVPVGMAHTGAFENDGEKGFWRGFGPMMGHGMMDGDMYAEMEEHMDEGNFTGMENDMEQYTGDNWKEMHEYCERAMGIEDDEENERE